MKTNSLFYLLVIVLILAILLRNPFDSLNDPQSQEIIIWTIIAELVGVGLLILSIGAKIVDHKRTKSNRHRKWGK